MREPSGHAYESLLSFGAGLCDTAVLVVRARLGLSDAARALLDRLGPHIRDTNQAATEWPGTKLAAGMATVVQIAYNDEVRAELTTAVRGLYDWRQPDLPEDLALLRADDSTAFLGSISHEHDAFLTIDNTELESLRERAPSLAAILRPDA